MPKIKNIKLRESEDSELLLYKANDSSIYLSDFAKAFKKVGIKKGDVIFIYSDISAFGRISVSDRDLFLGSLVEILKQSVGKGGTIIMPTFTYSIGKGKVFDLNDSPSTVGALTEYFRNLPNVKRTLDPILSVAIWGKRQKYFSGVGNNSFGRDSIFDKFNKIGGKLLFLGSRSCTFFHYIENIHGVPYRFEKPFLLKIKNGGKIYKEEFIYYARRLELKDNVSHFSIAAEDLAKKGFFKKVRVGYSAVASIKSEVLFQEVFSRLNNNMNYYLKSELNELEEKTLI